MYIREPDYVPNRSRELPPSEVVAAVLAQPQHARAAEPHTHPVFPKHTPDSVLGTLVALPRDHGNHGQILHRERAQTKSQGSVGPSAERPIADATHMPANPSTLRLLANKHIPRHKGTS